MITKPETIAIEDLIAHRGRMRLIGEILEFDTREAMTRSIASEQWPLCGADGIDPLILLELVAQTAGICNGWKLARQTGATAVARGWLVGIKRAEFFIAAIAPGTEIIAIAQNDFEFEGFREVKGRALIAGKVVAEVTLQVVQA